MSTSRCGAIRRALAAIVKAGLRAGGRKQRAVAEPEVVNVVAAAGGVRDAGGGVGPGDGGAAHVRHGLDVHPLGEDQRVARRAHDAGDPADEPRGAGRCRRLERNEPATPGRCEDLRTIARDIDPALGCVNLTWTDKTSACQQFSCNDLPFDTALEGLIPCDRGAGNRARDRQARACLPGSGTVSHQAHGLARSWAQRRSWGRSVSTTERWC